jgi:hypothetical protein
LTVDSSVVAEAGIPVAATPLQAVLLDLMALCWLLAVVLAVWGAVREARRADRERRRILATEVEPGPTPGIEGLLDRWGLWALLLGALGVVFLGLASTVAHL